MQLDYNLTVNMCFHQMNDNFKRTVIIFTEFKKSCLQESTNTHFLSASALYIVSAYYSFRYFWFHLLYSGLPNKLLKKMRV